MPGRWGGGPWTPPPSVRDSAFPAGVGETRVNRGAPSGVGCCSAPGPAPAGAWRTSKMTKTSGTQGDTRLGTAHLSSAGGGEHSSKPAGHFQVMEEYD